MPEQHAKRRQRVLIVDDEPALLSALAQFLNREFEVTTASTSEHAVRVLSSDPRCDLVLCDLHMPGLNGLEFATRAVQARPELVGRVALMTGGAMTPHLHTALEQSGLPVLMKPFDLAELRDLIVAFSPGDVSRSP